MQNLLTKTFADPELALICAVARPATRRGAWPDVSSFLPRGSSLTTAEVEDAFTRFGSDKGSAHSYAQVYAAVVGSLPDHPRILEIGLGTTDTSIPCNMGASGTPGASLRALRHLRPDADVHGADIDEHILFTEEGITTHWVDQLAVDSLRALGTAVGGDASVDLVIDDGLHSKRSNLNTFRQLFPLLRPGGTYVIEDVHRNALDVWRYLLGRRGLAHAVLVGEDAIGSDIDNAVLVRAAES